MGNPFTQKHKTVEAVPPVLHGNYPIIDRKKIFNELQKLKSKKASQETDIPVKIIKENMNILFTTISIIHCLVHIFHQI